MNRIAESEVYLKAKIWIATYWTTEIEPVVTPFDNREAAETCARYYERQGYKVCIDECDLFHTCTEQEDSKKKMTKEEALDWLISRKEHYELDDDCQELAEAIGIGIDAINQEMKRDQEMNTGHWIWDTKSKVYRCSCCNYFPWGVQTSYPDEIFEDLRRTNAYKYCPNCGAKMTKESDQNANTD